MIPAGDPNKNSPSLWFLLEGHPRNGPSLYTNSRIATVPQTFDNYQDQCLIDMHNKIKQHSKMWFYTHKHRYESIYIYIYRHLYIHIYHKWQKMASAGAGQKCPKTPAVCCCLAGARKSGPGCLIWLFLQIEAPFSGRACNKSPTIWGLCWGP